MNLLREISTPEVRGSLVILMPAAANSGDQHLKKTINMYLRLKMCVVWIKIFQSRFKTVFFS